jgi:hypothetical protein
MLVIVLLSLLLWAILLILLWRLFDTESVADFQENITPARNSLTLLGDPQWGRRRLASEPALPGKVETVALPEPSGFRVQRHRGRRPHHSIVPLALGTRPAVAQARRSTIQ